MLNIWFVIVVVVARTFILLFRHIICLTTICLNCKGQDIYFSPLSNLANKETISPFSLGWCLNEIDTLYDYLQQENSKGFIVLNDGEIVLEKYFGTFTQDSLWYWASAGKTITSFLVGKAQEENYLFLSDTRLVIKVPVDSGINTSQILSAGKN